MGGIPKNFSSNSRCQSTGNNPCDGLFCQAGQRPSLRSSQAPVRLTVEAAKSVDTSQGSLTGACSAVAFGVKLDPGHSSNLSVEIKNGTGKHIAAYQYLIGPIDAATRQISRVNQRTAFGYVSRRVLDYFSATTETVPFTVGKEEIAPEFAIRPTLVEFADGTGCFLEEARNAATALVQIREATNLMVKAYLNGESLESLTAKSAKSDLILVNELRLFMASRPDGRSELAH